MSKRLTHHRFVAAAAFGRREGRHRARARGEGVAAAGDPAVAPIVDRTLPLASAAEAHRLLEAGDIIGKIVLLPQH